MEACFGDVSDEEENLAYSILKSIKKVKIPLYLIDVLVEHGQQSESISESYLIWWLFYDSRFQDQTSLGNETFN